MLVLKLKTAFGKEKTLFIPKAFEWLAWLAFTSDKLAAAITPPKSPLKLVQTSIAENHIDMSVSTDHRCRWTICIPLPTDCIKWDFWPPIVVMVKQIPPLLVEYSARYLECRWDCSALPLLLLMCKFLLQFCLLAMILAISDYYLTSLLLAKYPMNGYSIYSPFTLHLLTIAICLHLTKNTQHLPLVAVIFTPKFTFTPNAFVVLSFRTLSNTF